MTTKLLQKLIKELSVLFENSVLPNQLINDLPRKWEKHGDLVVFPMNTFKEKEWKIIDQNTLWACVAKVFKVTRVAKQQRISTDGFRTPMVVMLFGEDTWVTHLDNKIKYSFDVTKNMFSSGNITEKMRMSKLDCSKEIVVDMFAGIGYFTLPLLVHSKAKHLHACEWNPAAVSALKFNLKQNKVDERCTVYHGDNREVCPTGIADRILLGLIPSASKSYLAACRALNPVSGGIMHIHCNVTSNTSNQTKFQPNKNIDLKLGINSDNLTCNRVLKPEWVEWGFKTALEIKKHFESISVDKKSWTFKLQHIERVKSYAPHIDHLVLDLICLPIETMDVS